MDRNGKNGRSSIGASRRLERLVQHLTADDEMDPVEAAREDAWARALRQQLDGQIAAMRRQLMPDRPVPRRPAPISEEILALPREILLARLEIMSQSPHIQIAHMNLSGLTTEDMRQLLAELEAIEKTLT